MRNEHNSDPLAAARGCLYAIPVGIFMWAIIIAVIVFVGPCAHAQDAVIDVTPVEVIAEKQAIADKTELDKLKWEVMKERYGTLPENIATHCIEETPGTLDVYSESIRYMKDGLAEPIEMVWIRGLEAVYESVDNSIGAHVYKDGSVLYRDADQKWGMRVTPVGLYLDDKPIKADAAEIRFHQTSASTVHMEGYLPLGINATWRVGRGKIKETLIATESLRDAVGKVKRVTIVSRVEPEDKKVPWIVTIGDEAHTAMIRDANTGAVFATFREPIIVDAAGESTIGSYSYGDGLLGVDIDPAWLLNNERIYPIEIDPTVDQVSGSDIQECGTLFAGESRRVWLKFDLPAITGTCDSVDFVANFVTNANISETYTLSVFTTADATAWNTSTTCATMDAFTYYTTGVSQVFTSGTGTGLKTWAAIDGPDSDANAITYLYDNSGAGVCNPGVVTLKIEDQTGGTNDRGAEFVFSRDADGGHIDFHAPSDATPPKLTITYTGSLGCTNRKGSGSAGMIMGKAIIKGDNRHGF